MEWVETTGKNIEEAVNRALDQLGIAAEDAEIETIEEPKAGLFGRTRGTARVRARVRPTSPRPKQERRSRSRKGRDGREKQETAPADQKEESGRPSSPKPPERSRAGGRDASRGSDRAKDDDRGQRPPVRETKEREMMPEAEQRDAGEEFLRGVLDTIDLEGTVVSSLDDAGVLSFEVNGEGLGLLIGPGLVTLEALQEICRNAIQRQAAGREYGKVELDVAGARAQRKVALEEFTRTEANRVLDSGDEVIFDVMSRSDRKIVHDVIAEFDELRTESVGEDPRRRVVLRRA